MTATMATMGFLPLAMRRVNRPGFSSRVLQKFAWDFAERLSWEDTFTAEYVALAQVAATLVPVASYEEMPRVPPVLRSP